jgi:RNA polymerase sigma-70 factor (ECF subfamily)
MSNHPPSPVRLSLVGGQDGRTATDGDVARALGAGEKWAAVEAWRRFAPMVLRLAKRTLGSTSDAEDVAQDVFHRVYRKVRLLREPDSLRNFIYTIAVRALRDELHRKKMRSWFSLTPPASLDAHVGESLDVESRDLLRRFYQLLERLGSRDRLIFIMRRVESMSVEEIAAATETSESTVKRSLAHASSRLSVWMEDQPRIAYGEEQGR